MNDQAEEGSAMRIARVLLGIALLAVLALPSPSARAAPTSDPTTTTYSSCIQVQNLAPHPATLTLTFYDSRSSATYPYADPTPIPSSMSRTYCPLPAVPSGFRGSVLISSDTPLATITNVYTVVSGTPQNYASYTGFRASGSTAYLPLLMYHYNGYDTWFYVQNTGTQDTDITVTYSDYGSVNYHGLHAGQAHMFDQTIEGHSPGWVGSATVTATGNQTIAATVIEVSSTTLLSYGSLAAGSYFPVMPLVQANNYGYSTLISIFNIGTRATDVTVVYTPSSAGTTYTEVHTINAGQTVLYGLSVFGTNTFVGSGKVTVNSWGQPLTAIVNQTNSTAYKGGAYSAFDPASATSIVVMPLIMDRNYGYFTGFNVQNVGVQTTTVKCTFTNTSYTVPATTLQPGQSLTDVQLSKIGSGYVGAATCMASGGNAKIMGIVNELNLNATTDTFMVYEAVND